jgi:hypothetical protein
LSKPDGSEAAEDGGPTPAPTWGSGSNISGSREVAATPAEACAAARAAAASGDEEAFKTHFWRTVRALDRDGRKHERDVRALLVPRGGGHNSIAGDDVGGTWTGSGGGSRAGVDADSEGGVGGWRRHRPKRPVIDLINVRDAPPMEWSWSTDSSIDMGAPEEAREKLAAMGVMIGEDGKSAAEKKEGQGKAEEAEESSAKREGAVQAEWEIKKQLGEKEEAAKQGPKRMSAETMQLLMDSRSRSTSPSPMLTAIEDQLKQVGLHKNRPDRAYVEKPTAFKTLSKGRVAKAYVAKDKNGE